MKKILIFSLILLLPAIAFGRGKLSLSEAVKRALKNNYQVNIYSKNYQIAKNNNSWGAAGALPFANVGVTNVNRYDNRAATFGTGRDEYTTHQLAPYLQLSWTIFDGFSISTTKDILEKSEEASLTNKYDVEESTIKSVVQQYYRVLLEKEKLNVFKELLDLSRDRYRAIQLKKDLGAAVTFELLQEKNAYLKDSSNLIAQQVFYRNAVMGLNFLLNEPPDTEFDLTENFTTTLKNYNLNDLYKIMLEENVTLKGLRINKTVQESNVDIAESAWYPSLSLNSGLDYSNGFLTPAGMESNSFYAYDAYANLTLSFLLYNGGNRERAIENSNVQQEISQLMVDEMTLNFSNRMKNLFDLYNLRKEIYAVSIENKKAAKLNLDIASEKFDSGAINSFNYRDIQLIYLNASIDELNSIYNLIETETEILKLTGGIDNSQWFNR
jgi:outer membrane protein